MNLASLARQARTLVLALGLSSGLGASARADDAYPSNPTDAANMPMTYASQTAWRDMQQFLPPDFQWKEGQQPQ